MDTARKSLPLMVTGTLLCGVLAAGCGESSDPDGPDATATPTPTIVATPTATVTVVPDLVAEGARLFFAETFDGNGRTCGTCHPAEAGFTLTPEFIAALPPEDPLFVAERVPELAGLENPALLRGPRALILENIDGFDQPPVFRGVPHIFDLALTPPFGWSSASFSLDEFVGMAVRQHFPRTLNRVPGVDFRLPTLEETVALVAFMESMRLGPDGLPPFEIVTATTDAQRRGEALFFGGAKCSFCHNGPLFTDNVTLDTGVTRRAVNAAMPPGCAPDCRSLGELEDRAGVRGFNVPTLLGLTNSAPYFHDNSAATIRETVAHYASAEFTASAGGALTGGIRLTEAEIDDVTAFLELLPSGAVVTP